MTAFFQLALLGAATGAVYALLAQGVVLIHRASGIVNFAQGAFAVVAGFLFAHLTQDEDWGTWTSLASVTAVGAAAGVAVFWLVIRPLRDASPLTRVVATIAVLVIIQALAILEWGNSVVLVPSFLPSSTLQMGPLSIGWAQITLFVLACVLTLVLWLGTRFTLLGVAFRAVAENQRATAALGWSPSLLATLAWGLSGMLGAAAGVLILPVTGVQVGNMTLYLVVTLAAALFGRFASFPLTLLGAIAIGVLQALAGRYVDIQGVAAALPFLLIVTFLVVRGQALAARGQFAERFAELGSGRARPWLTGVVAVVLGLLVVTVFPRGLNDAVTVSLAFVVIMLSVVVLTGYTGQLSLAQMCFAGLGALFAGRLVQEASFPFAAALLLGVLLTIPVGVLFAVPALRTRGITLAIVTLGLGFAVNELVFRNADYTGATEGTPVGAQSLFGWDIDAGAHPERYALITLVLVVLCGTTVARVRRSRVGRRMVAVRSNERAAQALGINVYGVKLYAFGLSAAIAALGGILLGFQFQTIQYGNFDPFVSLLVTGLSVIGGIGYATGPLTASPLVGNGMGTWLTGEVWGTGVERWLPVIGGLGLLFTLLQNPNGLAGNVVRGTAALSRRLGLRRRAVALPPLPEVEVVPVEPATLEARDLVVRFGGVTAVDGVGLTLRPGRISGLIGPNGAGKTTIIDCITGFVRPSQGTITLNGQRIDTWPTHRRARAGVSRSFQSLELFDSISASENLLAASEPRDTAAYVTALVSAGERQYTGAAAAAIREFGLEEDLDRDPSELSYGRRRLLAIARAVAVGPSVLLLDEPAAGLDEAETAEMAALVRNLATSWGIAILLVEHDIGFVMSVCDEITVIDFGRQIACGAPAEVQRDPAVLAAYLGEPAEAPREAATADRQHQLTAHEEV